MAVPRFRFAPSPTGIPHVGNMHTALFCWSLARGMGGDFILRIEDTDPERNTPAATRQMLQALQWLGLDWDEGPDIGGDFGPYIQSQRLASHRAVAEELVERDLAYYGDDPRAPAGSTTNQPLRLRMTPGRIIVHDLLHGPIAFDNSKRSEDPVIMRSDGTPLYHLAAMTDDHNMAITHVVRGEEWLSSAAIHVQLYQAMGWSEPIWIHLPLILNKRGEKLKKRDPEGGYLITDFQEAGYLPEALLNYLLLLGWSPGEQEIVGRREIGQLFRPERLSPSPAIFDWDKLNWVNRQYLQRYSPDQLLELLLPYLEEQYGILPGRNWLFQLVSLVRQELIRLTDIIPLTEWAFDQAIEPDDEAKLALNEAPAGPIFIQLMAELAHIVLLDSQTAAAILRNLRNQNQQWTAKQILQPIRAALTGRINGPPLADLMTILGKQRCLERLAATRRPK